MRTPARCHFPSGLHLRFQLFAYLPSSQMPGYSRSAGAIGYRSRSVSGCLDVARLLCRAALRVDRARFRESSVPDKRADVCRTDIAQGLSARHGSMVRVHTFNVNVGLFSTLVAY
jgi:hypothetical protein